MCRISSVPYMASQFLRLARILLFIPLAIFMWVAVGLAMIFLAILGFVQVCSGKLRVLFLSRVGQSIRLVKSPRRVISKCRGTQTDALARKKARRDRGQLRYAGPLDASKATESLPRNNVYFVVPGHQTYSGKDIRRAVFAAHMERAANAQRTQPQIRRHSSLKPFRNYDYRIPQLDTRPLNTMQGSGLEFPIGPYTNRQKGPARVIVQFTNGHTEFQGVVARDVSRPVDSPGSSDHFKITPYIVETFWDLGETFINEQSTPRRSLLKTSLSYFVRG